MSTYPISEAIAKRSGSNFLSSFFFLPKSQREAMMVLYALSRTLDDVVDEEQESSKARAQLELWRQWIQGLYRGDVGDGHPILVEFHAVVLQFGLKEKYVLDLIAGMEMDLEKHDYQTFQELETYCYHVAGTVGLLCNQIFGFQDERTERYALLLGTALQLTNILRDVGSDAQRGRVYLPVEDMRTFHYTKQELLAGHRSESFLRLMEFEAARADDYFQRANQCLSLSEREQLAAANIMSQVYYGLLQKLRRQQFPVFGNKVGLSKWGKVKILFRAFWRMQCQRAF